MLEGFPAEPERRVREYLETSDWASSLGPARVSQLAGDASNRLYYRALFDSGVSRILSLLPSPFVPEELPFLEVAELFLQIRVPVPRIYDVQGELGVILLEDLGDNLLQDEATACAPERKRELYREAVELLLRLQHRGRELRNGCSSFLPFRIAFDEEKFFQELDFFRAHFLQGLREAELDREDERELGNSFRTVARELAAQPYVLCHRDYHSRNLIVSEGRLTVIDFQDARMGPRSYDLVSLLNDSYVTHDGDLVAEMKALFFQGAEVEAEDIEREYDLAALQRNLKALGTFGFQITQRGNDVYRRYVASTLALVRDNLARNERWDRLGRTLAKHLPELG